MLLLQIVTLWLLLVAVAIFNAAIREKILLKIVGHWSLPLSGLTLSILIFFVTLIVIPLFTAKSAFHYWMIGGMWLILTLSFEFLFGHYVIGKSWTEIFMIFNVLQGNLMSLVLLTTFFSPYLAAHLRQLL